LQLIWTGFGDEFAGTGSQTGCQREFRRGHLLFPEFGGGHSNAVELPVAGANPVKTPLDHSPLDRRQWVTPLW
jgi:hypothetical protein